MFLPPGLERNQPVEEQIEADILSSNHPERVSYVHAAIVCHGGTEGGQSEVPPTTIHSLLSGLSREMLKNKFRFAVIDRSDVQFRVLHLTLDSVSSELRSAGIGVSKMSTQVLFPELEDLLWENGALGSNLK